MLLIVEKFLPCLHLAVRKTSLYPSKQKVALIAGTITIHDVPEGPAIASAFAADGPLGWLVAASRVSSCDLKTTLKLSAIVLITYCEAKWLGRKLQPSKTGAKCCWRDLSPKDSVSELRSFIAVFVKENAFLLMDKVPSMKKEREWFKNQLEKIKQGKAIDVIAQSNGKIIGKAEAKRGEMKNSDNVSLGIAILPEFRGAGLGRILLRELIARVKKEFKPKNIWLSVVAPNKRACVLYKRLGFEENARLPNWFKHKGTYSDEIRLILKR
ncbi:hypothetical protein AUJ65_04885 [Candidatus Micrarchaeota archaeon CG1_02_51_15]|nr:MAG: hypothetical protein AUJ65_04885 [Candidatus Micrarchaeota archaeon CG1_02_51_15]